MSSGVLDGKPCKRTYTLDPAVYYSRTVGHKATSLTAESFYIYKTNYSLF
jgi:hypothetical protein